MSYAVARNITADASFIAITPFLCTFVMCFSLPLEGDVIIAILMDAKVYAQQIVTYMKKADVPPLSKA